MTRSSRLIAIVALPLCLALAADAEAQAQAPKKDPKAAPQAQPQWKKGGGKLDPKLAEAKRLFDEGATAYTEGNYDKAIESWEMSYDISKKELICESIANAYERLGKPKQAREYLERWRNAAPPEERDTLDARLKNLEERIAREEEAERKSQEEREKRDREQKTVATPPPKPGPSIPGIILAGVGVGAVATGIVLDIVASNSRPDESVVCKSSGGKQLCLSTDRDAIEGSNRQAFIGDVLWIAGSVTAAVGGVLLVTHAISSNKPKADSTTAIVAPFVTPHGGGVAAVSRF